MSKPHWQQNRLACLARAAQLYNYYLEAESSNAKTEIKVEMKKVLDFGAREFKLNMDSVIIYRRNKYGKPRN